MKRSQETKEIIAARLSAPHYAIDDLGECSEKFGKIWLVWVCILPSLIMAGRVFLWSRYAME